jgi:hypothetical protein
MKGDKRQQLPFSNVLYQNDKFRGLSHYYGFLILHFPWQDKSYGLLLLLRLNLIYDPSEELMLVPFVIRGVVGSTG